MQRVAARSDFAVWGSTGTLFDVGANCQNSNFVGTPAEPSFVRPLLEVGRPPPGIGSRPILYRCDEAPLLGPISSETRILVRFLVEGDFLMVGRAVGQQPEPP